MTEERAPVVLMAHQFRAPRTRFVIEVDLGDAEAAPPDAPRLATPVPFGSRKRALGLAWSVMVMLTLPLIPPDHPSSRTFQRPFFKITMPLPAELRSILIQSNAGECLEVLAVTHQQRAGIAGPGDWANVGDQLRDDGGRIED